MTLPQVVVSCSTLLNIPHLQTLQRRVFFVLFSSQMHVTFGVPVLLGFI